MKKLYSANCYHHRRHPLRLHAKKKVCPTKYFIRSPPIRLEGHSLFVYFCLWVCSMWLRITYINRHLRLRTHNRLFSLAFLFISAMFCIGFDVVRHFNGKQMLLFMANYRYKVLWDAIPCYWNGFLSLFFYTLANQIQHKWLSVSVSVVLHS